MPPLLTYSLVIGSAGFFGAVTRFLVTVACTRAFGPGFPVGTLIVNTTGSFAIGLATGLAAHRFPEPLRLAVVTGFLGAYTTFSTLAFDSHHMLSKGDYAKAALNLLGSLALGLLAVHLGLTLARR